MRVRGSTTRRPVPTHPASRRLRRALAQSLPELAVLHNDRAIEYASKGDNDRALADYNEAIRLDPNDADYYNNRGSSWHLKGDDDRAIADYDEAIRRNSKDPCPRYNRGLAWSSKNENDRAIADFNEALRLNPNYAAALFHRASPGPTRATTIAPSPTTAQQSGSTRNGQIIFSPAAPHMP